MSASGYKRVYPKHGAWHFVDKAGKWHYLCRIDEGEPAMLRALAKVKGAGEPRPGSMAALIATWRQDELPAYAESTRVDYGYMLTTMEAAMGHLDVAAVDAGDVLDLRDQWLDKPRTANKYQALLSLLMAHAIILRQRKTNPCFEVKKLKEAKRKRYVTHDELRFLLQGLLLTQTGRLVPSGPMMALLVLFAYLTGLRMVDVRTLTRAQVADRGVGDVIEIQPTKTKDSTGVTLEVVITPDMLDLLERARGIGKVKGLTVFHGLAGQAYSKDAVETAWQRARERSGITGVHFHDLRAKALSDAKRAGLSLDSIKDSAGHSSVTTTEGYLRGFDVKRADLALTLPKVSKAHR